MREDPLAPLCDAVRARLGGAVPAPPLPQHHEALTALAVAHKVAPLVSRAWGTAVPELQVRARAAAMRALGALPVLHEALDVLRMAGIPALAWKGPALSQLAWGDPGQREFDDLDIVVRPEDRAAARAALGRAGWRRRHPMTDAQEEALFGGLGAYELLGAGTPALLELHWSFSARRYPGRLPVHEVLARAQHVALGGRDVCVPDRADHVALLAAHGAKHGWTVLEDVAVFAAVASGRSRAASAAPDAPVMLDDALVVEAMRRAGVVGGARAVRLAAALAHEALEVGLPRAVAAACAADAALPSLVAAARARWSAGALAWRPTAAWDSAWMERTADRAAYAWRVLTDPTLQEWEAVRLPDVLLPFYPALRPARRLWAELRRVRR